MNSEARVALITGTSSGIGLLTSVEMARAGYRVIATMRDLGRRGALDRATGDAHVSQRVNVRRLDVTNFPAIPQLVESVVREHGGIDVLVNNAGFVVAGFAEDVSLDELRRQMETNFFAQVAVTQAVLPHMRTRGAGHVIMISSASGRAAGPGRSSYSASKFALEGWTESLRMEMNSLGVRVVLVEPGGFETDIWSRNLELADAAQSDASPNRERAQRLMAWAQKLKKDDPRRVARLVVRVAQTPRPRLRYMIGRDAHAHQLVRKVLPWKVYERVVSRVLGLNGK